MCEFFSMDLDKLLIASVRSDLKGIPGKNIKLLDGKSLIVWMAQAIQKPNLSNYMVLCIYIQSDI